MCSYFRSSPLDPVADHLGSSSYPVHALQFQREVPNLVGKLGHRTAMDRADRQGVSPRTVCPPLDVDGGPELGECVRLILEPLGIENAQYAERLGKALQPLLNLLLEGAGRPLPLALQQDKVAALQIDPDIGYAPTAAALSPRLHTVVTEQLRQ